MKFDWRKHDESAPATTYVRLAQVGDVLKFPNDNRLWQVESVTKHNDYVKVRFYGRRQWMTFSHSDRARLWFRFANPASIAEIPQG